MDGQKRTYFMTLNKHLYYRINESSKTCFDMRTSRVGRTGNSQPVFVYHHTQERRNLAKNPDFSESGGTFSVAPSIRGRRRPSHAVYVAMMSRINDANVSQKPVIHKSAVCERGKGRGHGGRTWSESDNIADPRVRDALTCLACFITHVNI